MTVNMVLKRLRDSGHKVTAARAAVSEVLVKSYGTPVSADGLFRKIKMSNRRACDLASVYRTLSLFSQIGIVRESDLSGESKFFEIVDTNDTHKHSHHIVCRSCKKIDPIEFCFAKAQEQALGELGYRDVTHRLEFAGLCSRCAI